MRMLARSIFLLFGSIFPLLIGILHTWVHVNQLSSPKVQSLLADTIEINGQAQSLWHTWGIMSFMMGIAFVIIGLLNLSTFVGLRRWEYPPLGALLTMFLYLCCVSYAGYYFEQLPQLWGGVIGAGFMGLAMILSLNHLSHPSFVAKSADG